MYKKRLNPFNPQKKEPTAFKEIRKSRLQNFETKEKLGKKTLDFVPIFIKNFSKNVANILSWKWEKWDGIGFLKSLDEAGISPNDIGVIRIYLIILGAIIYTSGLSPEWWVAVMWISLILDATDGKLARYAKKWTKSGEVFDPLVDKESDIISSLIAMLQAGNDITKIVWLLSLVPRFYQHYTRQFTPERWWSKEQWEMTKKFFSWFQDTNFVEKKGEWAANMSGKIKTMIQCMSTFIILAWHTPSWEKLLELLNTSTNETDIFAVILSIVSLYFWSKK